MKHIVRITALFGVAFALVLAGTLPAFAAWGDTTYLRWKDVSATMSGQSPHGQYVTTSRKCKVCHSVHNANPNGQALLMTNIADSCTYCHISAKVSSYEVYGGVEGNYKGQDFQNAHNTGVAGTLNQGCGDCHSVHAADSQMTANSYLTEKILSGDKVFDMFEFNYDELAGAPLVTDLPAAAITKWCTKCHMSQKTGDSVYYANDYYLGINTHVMKDFTTTYNRGSIPATQVAWSTSAQCSSCHTSQYGDGTHAWPHYTSGARFLVAAASSGVATSPVQSGQTKIDGVCLRCHRSNTSRGVGITW